MVKIYRKLNSNTESPGGKLFSFYFSYKNVWYSNDLYTSLTVVSKHIDINFLTWRNENTDIALVKNLS